MAFSDATRCNATTKSKGERCPNPAVTGSSKCRMHGGKSPAGINSGTFKDGRYSRYMPSGLLTAYQDAQADSELKDQRASIALIDAMIAGVLPNLDDGDSKKAWDKLKALVVDCRYAYKSENYAGLEKSLDTMEDVINRRVLHYASYDQVQSLLDDRRKHIETENKLELAGQRAISVEQVMLLMSQVLSVIQSVVTDRSQRHAIANEIQRLVSIPASIDIVE